MEFECDVNPFMRGEGGGDVGERERMGKSFSKMALVVKSTRIVLKDKIHSGCVVVHNGKITAIEDTFNESKCNNLKVCRGKYEVYFAI